MESLANSRGSHGVNICSEVDADFAGPFQAVRYARFLREGYFQIPRLHISVVWKLSNASRSFSGSCPPWTALPQLLTFLAASQNSLSIRLPPNSKCSTDLPH